MPAFKDTLLEHAYTCICYCLESRRQTARLAQLDAFMRGGAGSSPEERWAGLHQLIQEELQAMSPSECSTLIRMLPLLLQEQMVKAIPPPNTHLLSSLIQSLSDEHGTSSSAHFEITLWLLNVFATCKWTEPVTPVQLLKLLGRPSRIPKLEGTIFQCTLAIINAVKAVLLGSTDPVTIAIDLDALCPAIGQMILARLIDNLPRRAQRIADVVKDQTGLYLDLTRPFLLFKIDPRGVKDGGDLTYTQKWACKLASRLTAHSMFSLGTSSQEGLPSALPLQQVCLEIKDAKKRYNFDPFEAPSAPFKDAIAFQQGVATGLSTMDVVAARRRPVDPFWVFGQLPKAAFSCETAGLLYGLGLVGHLGAFKSMDIYEILAQRHEETSAALLFGMAISKKGSAEAALSQLIGVHIKDFHSTSPLDASQEIPLQVQVAALTSLGFLHLQSNDRRVSMVLLKELGRRGPLGPKSRVSYPPAYTASAGLALGLVNLGAGRNPDASGVSVDQVEQLLVCVNSRVDADYVVPACCLALLGMFLGSGDSYVADQIAIPELSDLKNPAMAPKPLHLFMRLLTKQLLSQTILFDIGDLTPTSDPYQNGYIAYIVAASCLAQGILHAGSQSLSCLAGLNTASQFLESSFSLPDNDPKSYLHHHIKAYLQFASDMIMLAKCLVMSGSGDLAIFQGLRADFLNGFDFSSTTAFWNHLALGFLTLGQGNFKASAIDETGELGGLAVLAITASILAGLNQPLLEDAFYFPHHWQSLWVLAIKPNYVEETKMTLAHPEELFLGHTAGDDESGDGLEMERRYLETITSYSVSQLAPQHRQLLKAFYCTFLPVFKPERCDMTVVHLLLSLDSTL